VILTGGIDLSVGAVLALCAVGAAAFMTRYDLDTAPTVLLVLALGGLVGIVNGLVTTRFNIQSFITTLAMLGVARGVASLWSGGYAVPLAFGDGVGLAPPSFKAIFAGQINLLGLEIPAPVFYFLGIGLIASFLLRRTGFGRHIYAVGGNETAARLSGVNVDRVKVIVFAISGLLAALAALLHAALVNQGSHIDGNGYELNAIAAVVIGGTSLAGGVGTVVGSMIGALTLSILDNILGLRNVQSEYQAILKGVIIVLAVVVQRQRR
jgi:ribose transport system permease protein